MSFGIETYFCCQQYESEPKVYLRNINYTTDFQKFFKLILNSLPVYG